MNIVLALLIALLCGAGYYEYTQQLQKTAAEEGQIDVLKQKVAKLVAENSDLATDEAALKKQLSDAQGTASRLNGQLSAAQLALTDAKTALADAQKAAAPPPKPTASTSSSPNSLGTIASLDGKTYQNCELLKVQTDGIVVNHSAGITEIPFGLLPPSVQQRFGFDPHVSAVLTADQVQALEDKRKAAGGN